MNLPSTSRRRLGRPRRQIVAAVAAGSLAFGGGAGAYLALSSPSAGTLGATQPAAVSLAATTDPATSGVLSAGSPSSAATPSGGRGRAHRDHGRSRRLHGLARLLARSDQASIQVRRHGVWVTYTLDRGKVEAASATSITLALPDGTHVTVAITPTTRLRGVSSTAAIVVGRPARVISISGEALLVGQEPRGR